MFPSSIQHEQAGGVEVVSLRGQFIGGKETDELRQLLTELIEAGHTMIILDMANVSYVNSTALGVLIAAHTKVAKQGGKIVLSGLSKSLENIFVITKLSMVFDIYRDRETALASFVSSTNQ